MLAPPALGPGLLPYAVVDAVMLLVEVVLLLYLAPRDRGAPTKAIAVLVAAGLVGSAGSLLAIFWAILYPNLNSFTIVAEAFGVSMGFPPGLWMIATIVWHDDRMPIDDLLWPAAFGTAATAGELLMGLVFAAAAVPTAASLPLAAATLVSPWYLESSALVMVVLVLWRAVDRPRRVGLLGLAATGAIAPLVAYRPLLGAALTSVAMAATLALVYRELRATPTIGPTAPRWPLGIAGGLLAMSAGGVAVGALGGSDPSLVAFGATTGLVMLAELTYLLALSGPVAPARPGPTPGTREAAAPTGVAFGPAPAATVGEPSPLGLGPTTLK